MTRRFAAALIILLFAAFPALARTKLAALPEREAVSVRFDNPSATLVEEERVLTLQEGENFVDFSWRGVSVDSESIRIAFLSHPEKVTLLSVSYPPGEAALVWRLHSSGAWEEKVRISYLLSSIDRLVAYKGVASRDEKTLDLSAFLILRNFSGEDFGRARFDLGQGKPFEGSSAHEETRQILFLSEQKVPIRKILTWDAAQKPWEPKRLDSNVGVPVEYEIANAKDSRLGRDIMWDGKFRVFQDDGRGGTIFLGENNASLTPVGEKMRIRIGESREVQVSQFKLRDIVVNPRPSKFTVRLWDTEVDMETEVENFKDEAVTVELIQHMGRNEWKMISSSMPFEKKDASTVLFRVEAPPKGKVKIKFSYNLLNVR